jgi:hypothetical protein
MTRRTRTAREAENRLADLEDHRTQTSTDEFDLSPLTTAERRMLDRAFDPDAPEGEQVEALVRASHERLDNPTDREVTLESIRELHRANRAGDTPRTE